MLWWHMPELQGSSVSRKGPAPTVVPRLPPKRPPALPVVAAQVCSVCRSGKVMVQAWIGRRQG